MKFPFKLGGFDEMFRITSGNSDMRIVRSRNTETGVAQRVGSGEVELSARAKKEENLLVAGRIKYPTVAMGWAAEAVAARLSDIVARINPDMQGEWVNQYAIADFFNAVEHARASSLSAKHYDNPKVLDHAVEQLQKDATTKAAKGEHVMAADSMALSLLTGKPVDNQREDLFTYRAASAMRGLTAEERAPDGAAKLYKRAMAALLKARLDDAPIPEGDGIHRTDEEPPVARRVDSTRTDGCPITMEQVLEDQPQPSDQTVKDEIEDAVDDLEQMVGEGVIKGEVKHEADTAKPEIQVTEEAKADPQVWEQQQPDFQWANVLPINGQQVPAPQFGLALPETDDGVAERAKFGNPTQDLWKSAYGNMKVFDAVGQTAPRTLTILVDCSGSTNQFNWGRRTNMKRQMIGWTIASELLKLSPESQSFGFGGYINRCRIWTGQKPGHIPLYAQGGGGTPTAAALIWAYEKSGDESSIVLITDDQPDRNAAPVAAEMRNRGVTLGIVGYTSYEADHGNREFYRDNFYRVGFPADLTAFWNSESDTHLLSELFDNIMA